MARRPDLGKTGKHPCQVPDCTFVARTLGGLGPHMAGHYRRGEIVRPDEIKPKRARRTTYSARDVCRTALEVIAPDGRIPVAAIDAYEEWVTATEKFMVNL